MGIAYSPPGIQECQQSFSKTKLLIPSEPVHFVVIPLRSPRVHGTSGWARCRRGSGYWAAGLPSARRLLQSAPEHRQEAAGTW